MRYKVTFDVETTETDLSSMLDVAQLVASEFELYDESMFANEDDVSVCVLK